MENFTWQQVTVIALGVFGVVMFFGFMTDSIHIHIGRKR